MKITLNNKELRTVFRGIYGLIETIYYIGEMPAKERPDDDWDDWDDDSDDEPDDPTPPEDHGAEPETEERTIRIGIGANVHGDLPGEIRERLEEALKRRFREVATEEVRRIMGDE
ncbi:MAG TPA: hypothetical protein IAB50_00185 [Candidatus Faecivicinus avistercoris]|nr:hypothetical protein [Candidatus Faecivicinus avistercoris]